MRASLDVTSDPTGFPMVWFDQVEAFVHWLPVTKLQFEHFLCAAPDAYFTALWYETALRLNPRVTPRAISPENYWRALMTAVQPAEAQRFASWCGDGFRLPTEEEWTALYRTARGRSAFDLANSDFIAGRDGRTRELLLGIDNASRQAAARMHNARSLANQMLFRYGAMEWVRSHSSASGWSAKGEPLPDFCGTLEALEEPAVALAAEFDSDRLPAAGFRLLWSPPAEQQPNEDDRSRTGSTTGG